MNDNTSSKRRKFDEYADSMPKKECILCGDNVPVPLAYARQTMCARL